MNDVYEKGHLYYCLEMAPCVNLSLTWCILYDTIASGVSFLYVCAHWWICFCFVCSKYYLSGETVPKYTSWLCRKKKNKHCLFLVLYFPRHCQGGSPHKYCSLTLALMILRDFFKIHFSWSAVFVIYNLPAIKF